MSKPAHFKNRNKVTRAVEYYIINTALPKKLTRIVYNSRQRYAVQIRNIISYHGLTPIPTLEYRVLKEKQAGRVPLVDTGGILYKRI